jgi:pimeloyl-ACP methyl ester carboxylesterase
MQAPLEGTVPGTVAERPQWLPPEQFPLTSRYLDLHGHKIHYLDEGQGPLLLFVHAGMWSFLWRDAIIRLREQFRCVALDFPGAGLSKAAEGYRPGLEAASKVLESFIRALNLEDITLVLHDLGGPVALGMSPSLLGRVRGIVVSESFGWPLSEEFPQVARMLRVVGGRTFGLVNEATNLLMRVTSTSFGAGRHLSREGRRALRGPYRDRGARRHTPAMLRDAASADNFLRGVDRALRTVLREQPVLLLYGAKSPTIKARFPDRWKQRFPHARLLLVEGGHHFPMADDPDLVAGAIKRWWSTQVRAA